jgi:ABC-type polar amino acid transport system ATPase subunit
MTAEEAPMIVLEGVEKSFGSFRVLTGVDLEVRRQEVVVVMGPSGSGKSTLIRCINRLERHDRGRIVVDGIELTGDLRNIAEVRAEVGMVFQEFNLFPHLTILENVALAPRRVRRCRVSGRRRRPWIFSIGSASPTRRRSTRRSSPGASSSGRPSPGPWPCIPR